LGRSRVFDAGRDPSTTQVLRVREALAPLRMTESKRVLVSSPFLGAHGKHHHAVRGYRRGELFGEFSQVFVLPQVADGSVQVTGISEILPRYGYVLLGCAAVEEHHGTASVLQLLRPDFQIAAFRDAGAFAT